MRSSASYATTSKQDESLADTYKNYLKSTKPRKEIPPLGVFAVQIGLDKKFLKQISGEEVLLYAKKSVFEAKKHLTVEAMFNYNMGNS